VHIRRSGQCWYLFVLSQATLGVRTLHRDLTAATVGSGLRRLDGFNRVMRTAALASQTQEPPHFAFDVVEAWWGRLPTRGRRRLS